MKPKTEELLYFLLWSCECLARPTFHNLNDSFESWAYRNGFNRQLARLERRRMLESYQAAEHHSSAAERLLRLTEAGRIHALGGRDPESRWRRGWDGFWRSALFDVPVTRRKTRNRIRFWLRSKGFGYLQDSVWISPDPLIGHIDLLDGAPFNVESLTVFESRPCAGQTDQEIVTGAWNFTEINRRYAQYKKVLDSRPTGLLYDAMRAQVFRDWADRERAAWLAAVSEDPLLPEVLLPRDYLGKKAWLLRMKALEQAADQARSFHP
jgi:phenylacetic acid degradation operon negative regulatory protein